MSGTRRAGRDRPHLSPRRSRQIRLRCTEEEFDVIAAAGRRAGLTPTGFTAEAALAAARGSELPRADPRREALTELMAARVQVRRFGTNVNQAVRALNTTGTTPDALARAVEVTTRAVAQLDVAAAELVRRLR